MGATAITLSFNARISIGLFVAISGHQSEQSRDLQLIIRPLNSTNAAKSFESLAYFHQKFLSNWCRSKPNKWRQNSSLKLVFTLKFSPFQNDIKGWFSTFISHFPHDWTVALIVYTYKAQKQLFLVNFMKRDYIWYIIHLIVLMSKVVPLVVQWLVFTQLFLSLSGQVRLYKHFWFNKRGLFR